MTAVDGRYFDGTVSACREVSLIIDESVLLIWGGSTNLSYPLNKVTLTPAVGSIPRSIRLPDGGMCEVSDQSFVHELEQNLVRGTRTSLFRRLERNLPLVATACGLIILLVVLFIRFGVPFLARQVAFALPPSVEKTMGHESLAVMDRLFTRPSRLSEARRKELTSVFWTVAASSNFITDWRIEFRSGGAIGANALALPSGIVLVTDELVALAKHDDEIASIMAHELGHVRQRHVIRHVLQNSAAGLLIATLTGDLVSITSLASTLPTALVNASFSRSFEREADDAAIAWMRLSGVPPRRYAEILGRLQAQLDSKYGTGTEGRNPVHNYLSTHPDTGERIRRIMSSGGK